jgi:hypothetical protein
MALGPGKYDDICALARNQLGFTDKTPGGVLVIVVGGPDGGGFSCQADFVTTLKLPDILERVAKEIRISGSF